ncbi:MAG TPA: hypothetical protein VGB70_10495 [Allosphingosinicella sp.]|jgi:hypothetical protein
MRKTVLALALLAAACGKVEPLRPAAGDSLPPKPAVAARAPTTDELLTPPPIARPTRTEDTLRRSEEREDDRFDLPPS